MAYTEYKLTYKLLKELLLTLNGINELYMRNGGLGDVSPGGFRRKTGKLIKILESGKEGTALEVRLHLANSFQMPMSGFF